MLFRNFRKWSIKVRLSFLIILVSTATSYVMYEFTHTSLHTSLSREENDFVYERLHTLRAIINEKPDYLAIIGKDMEWEGKNVAFPYYYLRFIDETGPVLMETPGMNKTIPKEWVPPPPTASSHSHEDVVRRASNGRYYLLLADSVELPHEGTKKLTIQIALDITSEVTIDQTNHIKIIALVVIRALFFAWLIIVIIKKTLKPLDEMVEFAEGITVSRMSERTDPENWPKEVRLLARSYNAMLDRLEEALTRLSHCASNMAHELRTPITNIMGEAEIALLQERSPEEYRMVLESAVEECARLSRLVNNLLFLAHAENPAMSIERTFFDPGKEIHDIYTLYAPTAEEKGAELTCHGNATLSGDPLLFRRAVSNLLTNALNYSPHGVRVDVSIRETEERYIDVVVCDTGFGISEKDLPRIFDRFYRGDSSRSNYAEGSGLGLSIVKAIMDLHGGSVTIESTPGAGTTFTLRFPKQ